MQQAHYLLLNIKPPPNPHMLMLFRFTRRNWEVLDPVPPQQGQGQPRLAVSDQVYKQTLMLVLIQMCLILFEILTS